MEKLMKNIYKTKDNHHYKALLLSHLYWSIYDKMRKTNRAEIFEHLYMAQHRAKTYLKLSLELYINLRTLERYRKEYVNSFKASLSILDKLQITLEVA